MEKMYLNVVFRKNGKDSPIVWAVNYDAIVVDKSIYAKATSTVASKFRLIKVALKDTVDQSSTCKTLKPIICRDIEIEEYLGFNDPRLQPCSALERHFLEASAI